MTGQEHEELRAEFSKNWDKLAAEARKNPKAYDRMDKHISEMAKDKKAFKL